MIMVAVKGMEIPKNCMDCPLTYPRWDFDIGCKCCKAIIGHHEEYGEYKTTRHPDCPLVEIVTCKDCKFNDNNTCVIDGFGVADDYFCAGGKRKE